MSSTATAENDAEFNARKQAAAAVTKEFVTELGGALKTQLQSAGPASAISVCRDIAPSIANRLSLQNGWKVTRVGTRVRNAMIGTPDIWEQEQLKRFEERAGKGEDYQQMSHAEIVSEPRGRFFRFMKPIPVAEVCLQCHGGEAQIADDVKAALDTAYPHDQAVNYALGDLRGAVSIKQPLDIALNR
ncbi:MAG: DUF3365 domain-containing protein [Gammaproteobacteria bacterium]|nr:DUF3365 domain-containing protein [Gammaproteobacteria bacterium]